MDYCAKLEDSYLSLKKCFPSVKFAENNDIQKHFKFISFSVLSVLMQSAESSTRAETVALENLAIVALSRNLGISAIDKKQKQKVRLRLNSRIITTIPILEHLYLSMNLSAKTKKH